MSKKSNSLAKRHLAQEVRRMVNRITTPAGLLGPLVSSHPVMVVTLAAIVWVAGQAFAFWLES